jgi:hypothetical protein
MNPMKHAVLVSAALIAGCGGGLPPTTQLATSQAALRSAKEVGADGVPAAAIHAKLSQEQIDTAQKMMANDDNESAAVVLLAAQADAELAISLTREAKAKEEAQKVQAQVASGGGK